MRTSTYITLILPLSFAALAYFGFDAVAYVVGMCAMYAMGYSLCATGRLDFKEHEVRRLDKFICETRDALHSRTNAFEAAMKARDSTVAALNAAVDERNRELSSVRILLLEAERRLDWAQKRAESAEGRAHRYGETLAILGRVLGPATLYGDAGVVKQMVADIAAARRTHSRTAQAMRTSDAEKRRLLHLSVPFAIGAGATRTHEVALCPPGVSNDIEVRTTGLLVGGTQIGAAVKNAVEYADIDAAKAKTPYTCYVKVRPVPVFGVGDEVTLRSLDGFYTPLASDSIDDLAYTYTIVSLHDGRLASVVRSGTTGPSRFVKEDFLDKVPEFSRDPAK